MLENNFLFRLVCLSFYFLHFLCRAIKDFIDKAAYSFWNTNNIVKGHVANFGSRAAFRNKIMLEQMQVFLQEWCRFISAATQRRNNQILAPLWRSSRVLLLSFHIFKYLVHSRSGIAALPQHRSTYQQSQWITGETLSRESRRDVEFCSWW